MTSRLVVEHPIIFTDLDGTLLDHHTYSHAAADSLLLDLQAASIPVIPVTSKTRAELMKLRAELNNHHPFITENGSAVFIPEGCVTQQPANTVTRDGYWIYELSKSRRHWIEVLDELPEYASDYVSFTVAGTRGIQDMTGLSEDEASLANQRDYSEPLQWHGNENRKLKFIAALQDSGAQILQGGRFMHVVGQCDKGVAIQWLAQQYQHDWQCRSVHMIAAGDSYNDVAMLEVADSAIQVRSPAHDFPEIKQKDSIYQTQQMGPQGWVEGINSVLYGAQQ